MFTNKRAMRRRTMAAFRDLGVTTVQDPSVPVALLSGGQRQSVAIARSALWAKRVIFFDEPTAALGVVQTRRVLDLIRRVRDQGLGVVLITHTLPDALEVADRVEVLRFGRRSAHFDRADATIELLVAAITGAYTNVAPRRCRHERASRSTHRGSADDRRRRLTASVDGARSIG